MWPTDDTIAAIASPEQQGLRAIIRLSGPGVRDCVRGLFYGIGDGEPTDSPQAWLSAAAAAVYDGVVRLPAPLGETPATLLYWPGQSSYTRQPAAELHLPGCRPIVDACLAAVCRQNARLARPGEFTLRAFLAGRIDLTQAEAVLGVIDAQSQAELDVALRQLSGNLAQPLAAARQRLLTALSHLEAGLDFADEEIEFITSPELTAALRAAEDAVEAVLRQVATRAQGDGPPRVVLYGRPNSGKSSLLNRICEKPQAIVASRPGTTRDYVAAVATHQGRDIEWIDTAGFDPSLQGYGDVQAQALGRQQLETAAVKVLCLDLTAPRTEWEQEQISRDDPRRLTIGAKADLVDEAAKGPRRSSLTAVCSSVTGEGVKQLLDAVVRLLNTGDATAEVAPSTAARSRASLVDARSALAAAQRLVAGNAGEELVATELRDALDHLGAVAGQLHHEEVLDQVFRQFCIGK